MISLEQLTFFRKEAAGMNRAAFSASRALAKKKPDPVVLPTPDVAPLSPVKGLKRKRLNPVRVNMANKGTAPLRVQTRVTPK